MHASKHAHMHTHTQTDTHRQLHTHTCTQTDTHTDRHTQTVRHTHTCTQTDTHTDRHTQTVRHTHMYKCCNCWQVYYNEHSLVVPYNISMATDNHFELIGLQPSKSYLVNVTAENAKGEGPPSDPILLQTTPLSNGRQHGTQWGRGSGLSR